MVHRFFHCNLLSSSTAPACDLHYVATTHVRAFSTCVPTCKNRWRPLPNVARNLSFLFSKVIAYCRNFFICLFMQVYRRQFYTSVLEWLNLQLSQTNKKHGNMPYKVKWPTKGLNCCIQVVDVECVPGRGSYCKTKGVTGERSTVEVQMWLSARKFSVPRMLIEESLQDYIDDTVSETCLKWPPSGHQLMVLVGTWSAMLRTVPPWSKLTVPPDHPWLNRWSPGPSIVAILGPPLP